ncbi:MAG: hypothetical protein Q7W02_26315 [Candidatus Rokubacteria bacterium]|nr:hypothetical protein [Candidatus Rokubacteria bacterium]
MDKMLGRLTTTRKTGAGRFHEHGKEIGFDLLSFWQWSTSDLVSNVTRGRLAEYVVARALGMASEGVRDEWAAFDLVTPSGIKVEVKSAAHVQSWHQRALSPVSFVVPKTLAWDADTNVQAREARRQADVYVFALLAHVDKATIDPLDLGQWRFYVLPTSVLDGRSRSQHSITLKSLERLAGLPVEYSRVSDAVERAAGRAAR